MGGEELAVPANGIVPSGAIRTFGPCKPDIYQWTALAKSSTGKVLAEGAAGPLLPDRRARAGKAPDRSRSIALAMPVGSTDLLG